jgi:VCBS repeat-containing protein
LAGHFSANSALAADYASQLLTTDLVGAPQGLFTNAIIFSAGCHAGYNIVNQHGIPVITFEPDWAQAFARQGATLIAGTGYQYGDTDFIEYSERLYVEFSRQLRAGTGPVSIGEALVRAKQLYLAGTPQMRGIHEKAYLEATLFGLPMLSVNMPGDRLGDSGSSSIVSSTGGYSTEPGATLGLQSAELTLPFSLAINSLDLQDPETGDTIETAQYLSGSNGVLANPSEPVLPLEIRDVAVSGTVLRGVGFRGGSYQDLFNILPLTAAPATEIRGVHTPFLTDVFYPVRPWAVNYFGAIAEAGGPTYLAITPAQVLSSAPGSQTVTLRQFGNMQFRLFYSSYGTAAGQNTLPAEADAPTIVSVSSEVSNGSVIFQVQVNGNPAAGVQQVWVTYTGLSGPFFGAWESLDLTQSAGDSTIWQGVLSLQGSPAAEVRFLVQAANGVGLVSMDTSQGAYYIPGVSGEPTITTALHFTSAPSQGAYGTRPTFSATLDASGGPVADQLVTFGLGPVTRQAFTNSNGVVTVALPLLALPGNYQVRATFGGTGTHIASFAAAGFNITKQDTSLDLNPDPASGLPGVPGLVTATLTDAAGVYLGEKMVIFVVHDDTGPQYAAAVITDYAGRARLGAIPLDPGTYTVKASFAKTVSLPGGETAVLYDQRYNGTSASGTLNLINRAPVAADDEFATDEDVQLAVAAPGLLTNDTDVDQNTLTAVLVGGPTHGTLTLDANGSFTYTPDANFNGSDSFTYKVSDGDLESNVATVTITINAVNDLPACSLAYPSVDSLWPPDLSLVPVSILGVTDPVEGDAVAMAIYAVYSDEPVGSEPDAFLQPDQPDTVLLRSDRDGNGNGRVYHILFTATDSGGGECQGEVLVPVVPHDQSGNTTTIDDGPLYDATVPGE